MIDIKRLKLDLANNYGNTGLINIEYSNGLPNEVCYVDSMNDETLDFKMIRHTVPPGGDKYFRLDFENLKRMTVKFNGSSRIEVYE